MERIKVNLVQDQISVENTEGRLFLGGTRPFDEKMHPGISNEQWIEYNKQSLGGQNILLDARDDAIYIIGEMEEVIVYSNIEYVSLSMCSRRQGRYRNRYQIDLDIKTPNKVYQFEIFNPRHFNLVIKQFINHDIECIDMIGIVGLYNEYPDFDKLIFYLDTHFNQMSKKFSLDHPRTTDIKDTYLNNINLLKGVFGGNRK